MAGRRVRVWTGARSSMDSNRIKVLIGARSSMAIRAFTGLEFGSELAAAWIIVIGSEF